MSIPDEAGAPAIPSPADSAMAVDGRPGRLSDAEASEFGWQLAGLTGADVPLASGLRALAEESRPGRQRRLLVELAGEIEAGRSLEEALDDRAERLPAPMRRLIAAGAKSGRLGEVLGRFLEVSAIGRDLRARVWKTLAYPILLMVMAFGVFSVVALISAGTFEEIFSDFGLSVPWLTQAILVLIKVLADAGVWLVLGPLVALAACWGAGLLLFREAERRRFLNRLPLFGPLWRYSSLAQFGHYLALLVDYQIPLPDALSLAAGATGDAEMVESIDSAVEDVRAGRPLGEALGDRSAFPKGFASFLGWSERRRGLGEAMRLVGEMFEDRARSQAVFAARFCGVVAMVLVIWWVGLVFLSLFLPMFTLLSALAGPWPAAPAADTPVWLMILAGAWVGVLVACVALAWWFRGSSWATAERLSRLDAERDGTPQDGKPKGLFRRYRGQFTLLGLMIAVLSSAVLFALGSHLDEETARWLSITAILSAVLPPALIGLNLLILSLRHIPLRFSVRHLMFGVVLAAFFLVLAKSFGWSVFGLLAAAAPPAVIAAAFLLLSNRRTSQQWALLRTLSLAARERLPLGPAVSAFGGMARGAYGREVVALGRLLESGMPLPRALDILPRALPREAAIVVRLGWDSNSLGPALEETIASHERHRTAWRATGNGIAYPILVLLAFLLIGSFMFWFITPRFQAIMADFQVLVPEPTAWLFRWQSYLVHIFPVIVLGILGGLGAFGLWSWVRWADGLPSFKDRLLWRRHMAIVLRALAAGVEGGRTLPEVLKQLADRYPRRSVRRPLRLAWQDVAGGQPWVKALRGRGVVRSAEAAVIESATRAGNLAWALREVADGAERRLLYRLTALGTLLRPVVVLALAGLVLIFAIAYFSPLIVMLEGLTEATP